MKPGSVEAKLRRYGGTIVEYQWFDDGVHILGAKRPEGVRFSLGYYSLIKFADEKPLTD